jgi:penicillin-binding protein 1A
LEDNKPVSFPVLSEETAKTMQMMLREVVLHGTGTRARDVPGAAGKTGTSDDYRAAWFVGYTPQLACAVWVGNDDYSPMPKVVGGSIPCQIWADFMKKAGEIWTGEERGTASENIVKIRICDETGKVATKYCPSTHVQEFIKGFEPKEKCDLHTGDLVEINICPQSGKIATQYCPSPKKVKVPLNEMPTETCPIHTAPPGEKVQQDEKTNQPALGNQ